MQPTEPKISIRVFISYAHADQELRKRLEEHLSILSYSGKITIWQDLEIPAGANWQDQIDMHLNSADLILLLISASFIASKYCWNREVQTALERHKRGESRIIPIILKPALWEDTPLGELQALPTGAKPVMQWDNQDAALDNVVRGIRRVVEELLMTSREEAKRKAKKKKPVKPQQTCQLATSSELETVGSASTYGEVAHFQPDLQIAEEQKLAWDLQSVLQNPPRNILSTSSQKSPTQPRHQHVALVLMLLILVLVGVGTDTVVREKIESPACLEDGSPPQGSTNTLGSVWHCRTSGTLEVLHDVAWSGSQFVVVGNSGAILSSPNGITWTSHTLKPSPNPLPDLEGIAWSGTQFVVVGTSGTILTSPNGVIWTRRASCSSHNLWKVAWSGSYFVAVGDAGTILASSRDGSTWTCRISSDSSQTLAGIAWAGTHFVVVGYGGTILTSPDGVTWTNHTSGFSQNLHGVAWSDLPQSGLRFVAVGDAGILASQDGSTWTRRVSDSTLGFESIVWSGTQFVAVGWHGTILISPDGSTWTSRTSGSTQGLNGVASSGSRLVVVGTDGTILTSP